MLPCSEFARLMSERYHHLLSQFLNDLERQVLHPTDLYIMNFPRSTPSLSGSGQGQQTMRRRQYHHAEPMPASTPRPTSFPLSNDENQSRDSRCSSNRITDAGSSTNPIHVSDDDEIQCEGCQEEGHSIGDCNKEYRFDGERYMPIPVGENPMEPTYVVDREYYRRKSARFQAESGKSTNSR